MSDDVIPEDVRIFVLQNIDSISQIEGLLLFCADPQAKWDSKSVSERLFITKVEAFDLMLELSERGLLFLADGKAHYQPSSAELGETVKRVADAYSRYLLPVTNLIHSKSKTRVQEFADAFIIKKDKEKD